MRFDPQPRERKKDGSDSFLVIVSERTCFNLQKGRKGLEKEIGF